MPNHRRQNSVCEGRRREDNRSLVGRLILYASHTDSARCYLSSPRRTFPVWSVNHFRSAKVALPVERQQSADPSGRWSVSRPSAVGRQNGLRTSTLSALSSYFSCNLRKGD
ncbi:hypothetical protein J6590_014550 [Homalodisca vitripennis]|nr:hypothetical protein J6590_014550 [Homalodisca vitripennis]